jgi:hypothetical protein
MELVKTNIPGFSKDMKSNVILNTDMSKYKRIQMDRQKNKEFENLKQDVAAIHSDLALIMQALGIKK